MEHPMEYIVIRLPLIQEDSFSHLATVDINAYAQQHQVTLVGEPISIQVEQEEIILVYKGYPYATELPVHLIKDEG